MVVVTGAGTGIGRATAQAFAKAGAAVLAVGRTPATLAETAAGLPGVTTLRADVGAPDAPDAIVAAALDLGGRIDVLVNNAAITRPAPLGEIDRGLAEEQIATNLMGPLFLTQRALPHLPRGGVVVNVTSNPPQRGWPRNSVYGSTKVALDFLTHTWAAELGARGVRVVSVAPGPTDTPVLLHAGFTEEEAAARQSSSGRRNPLGRTASAEEIAWWIVTVASPEAGYLTGAVVRVDGGACL